MRDTISEMKREETGVSNRSYLDWVDYRGYWTQTGLAGKASKAEEKSDFPMSAKPVKSAEAAWLDAAYTIWRDRVLAASLSAISAKPVAKLSTLRSTDEMRRILTLRGYLSSEGLVSGLLKPEGH